MSATDFERIVVDTEKVISIRNKIVDLFLKERSSIQEEDSYHRSYPYLLKYANETRERIFIASANNQDCYEMLVVLAHAIYGWMPTILEISNSDQVGQLNIVKAIKKINTGLTSDYSNHTEEIRSLARFTNNSFVGLSKLLHFLFPENYAIWDNNIRSILGIGTPTNNVNKFITYQKAINDAKKVICNEGADTSLRKIEEHLFYLRREND